MIRHYCDRCNKEILLSSKWFNPYSGIIIPKISLEKNTTNDDGEPIAIRKSFDLCETCFDNVLTYTEKSKI